MLKISSSFNKEIINEIPGSKSYANRALIYSFFKGYKDNIEKLPDSDDVTNLVKALKRIKNNELDLELGEGGTTIRFLLPLLASFDKKFTVKVHPRFKKRPIQSLFNILEALGAKIKTFSSSENILCEIQGPIDREKTVEVDCSKTTQFFSALSLINLKLIAQNLESSKAYIEMTKAVKKDLDNTSKYIVPVDFSGAANFIALAALNKEVFFPQILKRDPLQADDKIFDVLELIGASYNFSENGLCVYPTNTFKPFTFDVKGCPDLTMVLVFLALFLNGKSIITGIEGLAFKEVNRIEGIENILTELGAKFEITSSTFKIEGGVKPIKSLSPLPDHRLVMMSALILKQLGCGELKNSHCVSKSFPNFFDILNE